MIKICAVARLRMHTRITDILIKTGSPWCMLRRGAKQTLTSAVHSSTPRDDEHALILQYCQTLGGEGSPCSQPQSPAQILQAVEREERGELERVIARLEEEQRYSRVSEVVFVPESTFICSSFFCFPLP